MLPCVAIGQVIQCPWAKVLADKINTGLKKLLEAGEQVRVRVCVCARARVRRLWEQVGEMKIELQQKEVSLAEAQKVSQALLIEIQASTAKVRPPVINRTVIMPGVVDRIVLIDRRRWVGDIKKSIATAGVISTYK